MTNLPAAQTRPMNHSLSMLMDPESFNHAQRVGRALAISPLFPEHLRKGSIEIAVANAVLVLNMASRLNEDPLTVGQNIYFVGGKPGWSSSYMIAKANQHGVFRDSIDWIVKGSGDTLSVEAFGVLAATGKRVAVTCDMRMAKAEGWTKNPKYQSMPEQMLRYRSATFLIRLYCPEVMIGVPSTVELELGMRDVTPDYGPAEILTQTAEVAEATAEKVDEATGEVVDTTPTPAEATVTQAQADPLGVRQTEAQKPVTTAQTKAPDPEQFVALFTLILGELDSATPAEVDEMYGPQMEQMQAHAPDLFNRLRAAMAAKQG